MEFRWRQVCRWDQSVTKLPKKATWMKQALAWGAHFPGCCYCYAVAPGAQEIAVAYGATTLLNSGTKTVSRKNKRNK